MLSQYPFIFARIVTFSVALYYFLQFHVSLWDHFPYIWGTLFSIFFFNACLLVINSLFFYFYFCLGKSLFFIFAVCFCWYRIINWQLFSFNTLKMSIHYALTSIISAGKSGVSLFCCPFEWLSSPPPPVATFKISLCLWLHQSCYDLCQCDVLYSASAALNFLNLCVDNIHQFKEFPGYYLFNVASASLSVPFPFRILITQMLALFTEFHVFSILC